MNSNRDVLRPRHSTHLSSQSPKSMGDNSYFSKSDLNCTIPSSLASFDTNLLERTSIYVSPYAEYYKKYDHDEVPVKDSKIPMYRESEQLGIGTGNLTNSDLDRLEMRIYKTVSQKLQTDNNCSLTSLDSNIKFFKFTVEKIFERFYANMTDYEVYKKRFQEILDKSKEGVVDGMGDFIKDVFEQILSDSSTVSINRAPEMPGSSGDVYSETDSLSVMEAYKNEHFLTDSIIDEKLNNNKESLQIDDLINIFLIDGSPCVQIKLNDRNLVSEIDFKHNKLNTTTQIASADNLKNYQAKKIDLEQIYMTQHINIPERNIPVKISNPKKNIYLDEDFARISEHNVNGKSFLSKLCNILCKKFRKTTIG